MMSTKAGLAGGQGRARFVRSSAYGRTTGSGGLFLPVLREKQARTRRPANMRLLVQVVDGDNRDSATKTA